MKGRVLAMAVAFATTAAADELNRSQLLKSPRLDEGREPMYRTYTAGEVRDQIRVSATTAGESAVIAVHLPKSDNSIFAEVTFHEVVLVDGEQRLVSVQMDRGAFDEKETSAELRLRGPGLSAHAIERARGTARIRYPLAFETSFAMKGKRKDGIRIDGPFVTCDERHVALAVTARSASLKPVRAYDPRGRRLAQHELTQTEINGDDVVRKLAFWGEVARAHVDTVKEWAAIEIDFDLPLSGDAPGQSEIAKRVVSIER